MEPEGLLACVTGVMGSAESDAATVAALYERSYRRLVGVVALAADSRGDAEECVQEAFLRLLGNWSKVSAYDDPEAWVRHVAFRLLSNGRRHAKTVLRWRHQQDPQAVWTDASGDGLDIAQALATIPLQQRQVLVLHYLLGCSVSEIATALSIAPGTVKSRLSRGRSALAPLLSEESRYA